MTPSITLVLAKLYVQHHGFVFAPYVHFSLFPQLTEMLFTLMLVLFDDVASQSVCLLLLVLLVVALSAFGARLFSQTAAYWAAAILLANPMVIFLGSIAYVDMALTLFVTLALYMCWNWLHERDPQWVLWAAVFVGLALGTKYSAVFFLALIGLVVVGSAAAHHRYAAAGKFLAIALAVASPWYVRNVYYTGNPVFPFFPHVFGYGFWTPEDIAHEMYDLLLQNGVGRRPWSFIALPWHLAFRQEWFNTEARGDRGFFLLMPALLAFAVVDRRIFALCTVVLVYLVFWFFGSQETRYLVPVFPLISLAMGAALATMLRAVRVRSKGLGALLGALIFAVVAYPGWSYGGRWVHSFGFPPYTLEKRERFLSDLLPSYPAYRVLNTLKGRSYTLYAYEDQFMAYFCDGTFIGDVVGPGRYSRIRTRLADSRALYWELRSLDAGYFLIRGPERPYEDEFFRTHFRLMYARRGVELFEIAPPSQ